MIPRNCPYRQEEDKVGFRPGDTYELPVYLKLGDNVIGIDSVDVVEFKLGPIRKLYPSDVTWDTDHFIIPLSQTDTFRLGYKAIPCQARVLFASGQVKGTRIKWEPMLDAISKEVLS